MSVRTTAWHVGGWPSNQRKILVRANQATGAPSTAAI
jgi:hypothetical protein